MKKLVAVLMGGSSGEREISFLTGIACSRALKKKGYKVKEVDGKGDFVSKLKKIRPNTLGQALRIDGVTPAAAIIILSHIKRSKNRATA